MRRYRSGINLRDKTRHSAVGLDVESNAMKNHYNRINRQRMSLGELVDIVGACSKNQNETVATLIDLFESGRVRAKDGRKLKKIRISGN